MPHSTHERTTLIRRVLDHNQQKVLVGGDHDLVLLGAHAQKGKVVGRVQVADDAARLVRQLAHQAGILDGGRVVQRALDRDAC